MCMKISRVSKFLSFLKKIISFFSLIHRHQKLVVLFPKSAFDIKHAYVLVLFLALSLFVLAVFLKGFLKASSYREECCSHCSIPSLALLELYPVSYEAEDDILYYGFENVVAKYDHDMLHETYSLTNIIVEDNDKEFIPRLVHLELIEGATGSHEDYKDFIPRFVDVKLIKGVIDSDVESEEFHGFDGYDEDNDDEGGDDDVNSIASDGNAGDGDDLKIRVEEFIAKNISKWKEEMLNDKFLYLGY